MKITVEGNKFLLEKFTKETVKESRDKSILVYKDVPLHTYYLTLLKPSSKNKLSIFSTRATSLTKLMSSFEDNAEDMNLLTEDFVEEVDWSDFTFGGNEETLQYWIDKDTQSISEGIEYFAETSIKFK